MAFFRKGREGARSPTKSRRTEEALLEDLCWGIHHWEEDPKLPPNSRTCKVLRATMFAAKSTLAEGTPRRVFVQDLAASLNRKGMLKNERVENWRTLGYEYMEAV